jgi:predicted nucleic acid-binding protein
LKLIDTNVFIYAVGRPHEYKESCVRLLDRFENGTVDANIDVELLQEVLFYFWQRRRPADGLVLFDSIVDAFADPIAITAREALVARDLAGRYSQLEPRDAIHAAVVLTHGLEGIISADSDFNSVSGVRRFDPREF